MKKLNWILVVALFVIPGCGKTETTDSSSSTSGGGTAAVAEPEGGSGTNDEAPADSGDTAVAGSAKVATEETETVMVEDDGASEENDAPPKAPALPPPTGGTIPEDDGVGSDEGDPPANDAPEDDGVGSDEGDLRPTAAPEEAAAPVTQTERKVTGDWAMWGGNKSRNMVNRSTGISIDFKPATTPAKGKKVMWVAELGSQTYANPVVAEGMVIVGTNNGAEKRPKHKGDKGCLMAFDGKTGEFMWQLTRDKLPDGRVNDWPEQGICSTPCVEDGRVYVVTNRCEVQCLDIKGFHDGKNNGPYKDETDTDKMDADIIWSLDMLEDLGVFPHNLATSSPVIHGDKIFITTSNGVDEAHLEIPSPRAPSFLAINKNTGEVVWEDNSPEDRILHGQWSSPAIGVVNGKGQVYMPGGDGWLYAFDADSNDKQPKLLWKFDLNPKDSVWELGGAGTRNAIISTPVFKDNSVVLAVGQDPEHAEGVGHIYRMDATKTGDISPMIEDGNGGFKENPNSGQMWHFGGIDKTGEVTGEKDGLIFRRTLSTVSIDDGLVYAADLSGFIHCLDFATGERYWEHDTFSGIWGSTLVVDGKVFIGDEDGEMTILKTGKKEQKIAEKLFNSSVYSTPTIANGVLYVTDRARLYAIGTTK